MVRKVQGALCLGLASFLADSCGGPTAPGHVTITTIRYERVYQTVNTSDARILINVSIPSTKRIPFCFPEDRCGGMFVCEVLNESPEVGEDCSVFVNDPRLANTSVATSVFINNQRVTRVEKTPNGNELGRFRLYASGRLQ